MKHRASHRELDLEFDPARPLVDQIGQLDHGWLPRDVNIERVKTLLLANRQPSLKAQGRYPRPVYKEQPEEPFTYVLTQAVDITRGAGCTESLDANTTGFAGSRGPEDPDDLLARAAPPNGDSARVWFVFDPPAPGIATIRANVSLVGTIDMHWDAPNDPSVPQWLWPYVKTQLRVFCRARQNDRGYADQEIVKFDSRTDWPFGGFFWNGQTFTTPGFMMGVEPSSSTTNTPPVMISAGATIGMEVFGPTSSIRWDFCPGITVPRIVVDYVPLTSLPEVG